MTNNHFADVSKKGDTIDRERDRIECAIRHIQTAVDVDPWAMEIAVEAMKEKISREPSEDVISRKAAIDATWEEPTYTDPLNVLTEVRDRIKALPSAEPERVWISCDTPPEHHRDVIVRGIEAIGNVTVHKVMQWDVDTWRPTDYAPSVMWKEWSEI